jgi:V/A-type H+-transporting ATPase subunit E
MADEIKGLIEKIQKEGIQAAENKAREIEENAHKASDEIILRAKKEAQRLILQAKDEIACMHEKEKALLNQAARDTLLALRKEISDTLLRLVTSSVHQALTPEALYRLILEIASKHSSSEKEDILLVMKKQDLEAIEKDFLAKLKNELKAGIHLKSSQDILAGFTISFDNGRSCFDFTDRALAEFITGSLKPKLTELLKDATAS